MTARTRLVAFVTLAGLSLGILLSTTITIGQAPPQGGRGRGGDPAQRGGDPGGGGGRGQRRGGFPQYTRPLATQDIIVRGKGLYEANCGSCHAADLRGSTSPSTPNLLRSGVTLNDKNGERIGAAVASHKPAINLVPDDLTATVEYIHQIQSTMGGQGSPPGRNPVGLQYNLLVGDPASGEKLFGTLCASCHSVTGDLKDVGTKYTDIRDLQNTWVSGSAGGGGRGGGGGGRGGGGAGGQPGTVTLNDNTKLTGTVVRKDDFLVIITLEDGTRKSMARKDVKQIDVKDPREAHKTMAMKLIFDDPENKKMHDITAYLASIK